MGSSNKDKWLGKLKDSVQNYSEQLPDNFWEEIQKDIPAAAVPKHRKGVRRVLWAIPAAAVVLLAAFLYSPEEEVEEPVVVGEPVAVVQQQPTKRVTDVQYADLRPVKEPVVEDCTVNESGVAEVFVREGGENEVEPAGNVAGNVVAEKNVGKKESVVEKETEEVKTVQDNVGVGKQETGREEYLKELEYLQHNSGSGGMERGRKWLAFVVGNNGMQFFAGESMERGALAGPGSGTGSSASSVPPEVQNSLANETYIAGVLNLYNKYGSSPQWLGANSPETFHARSCPYDHEIPVRLGVMFAWQLRRNIYIESGISYQFLKSVLKDTRHLSQKLHYLGVPLRFTVKFVDTRVFSAYVSGGYLLEKCVYGELDGQRIKIPGLQNSVNASAGVQLNFTRGAALYVEPGLYRYVGMRNDVLCEQNGYRIKHIYSGEPGGFSFQCGLRFSF